MSKICFILEYDDRFNWILQQPFNPLRDYINEQAKKTPDKPDYVPHVPGTIRGKKWVPPKQPSIMEGYGFEDDIELDIDLGKDR